MSALKFPRNPAGTLNVNAITGIDGAELVEMELPGRRPLIDPILAPGEALLLSGWRGIGKSNAALSIALALCGGDPALGKWPAREKGRVLYIDGEMSITDVQARIKAIAAGSGQKPDLSALTLITPDAQQDLLLPQLTTPRGQYAYESHLQGTDLVIVDNIATLARPTKGTGNDDQSIQELQDWILMLRRRGIAVLIVHHAGKNGDQRGSSAREDVVQTSVLLREPPDALPEDNRFDVYITKHRCFGGEDAKPFTVSVTCEDGRTSFQATEVTREIDDVRELKNEGKSIRRIAEITGLHRCKVERLLKKIKKTEQTQMRE
jgi:putative DNA primase/helicase